MNITYILPSFYLCGGNRIAIEHCNGLAKRGHNVGIICINGKFDKDWIHIEENIEIVYSSEVRKTDWCKKSEAVVCTYFQTFYDMFGYEDVFQNAKLYYFVQQLEDRFFGNGPGKQQAINTYLKSKQKDVKIITEANWIKEKLKELYDLDACHVPLCQELPSNIKKISFKTKKPIVLVEGNAEAPAKGVQDAWEAVKDIDCYKVLLTNSKEEFVPKNFVFDKMFCNVPWEQALSVIKSCDVLVKPSYFEGSPTPPMEAWELGTAVVITNCTGWNEFGIDNMNCKVVDIADVEAMNKAILELIEDKRETNRLIENGFVTAKTKFVGWDKSIDLLDKLFSNR